MYRPLFYLTWQTHSLAERYLSIPRGTVEIVIQEVLWWIWGSYSAIWSIPLTNVKWHSDPWPTVTSQPIRLSTIFMTLIPSVTFTDYEWFPWSICNVCGMPAGNAYPSGHLVPSPIVGLACALIVETRFLDIAVSLLDFSPRIPLGTFSILLTTCLLAQNIDMYVGWYSAPLTCSNVCIRTPIYTSYTYAQLYTIFTKRGDMSLINP